MTTDYNMQGECSDLFPQTIAETNPVSFQVLVKEIGGNLKEGWNYRRLRDSKSDSQKGRGWKVDRGKAVEMYCKAADGEQMEGAGGCD